MRYWRSLGGQAAVEDDSSITSVIFEKCKKCTAGDNNNNI